MIDLILKDTRVTSTRLNPAGPSSVRRNRTPQPIRKRTGVGDGRSIAERLLLRTPALHAGRHPYTAPKRSAEQNRHSWATASPARKKTYHARAMVILKADRPKKGVPTETSVESQIFRASICIVCHPESITRIGAAVLHEIGYRRTSRYRFC